MGTIKIGQKHQKTFNPDKVVKPTSAAPKVLNETDKDKLIKDIMQNVPQDERVAALRKAGLNEEADKYQNYLNEQEDQQAKETEREQRLAEIKAMPEDEQLSLLLEEGFTDEAEELSKRLSAGQSEKTDEGDGEEKQPQEETVGAAPAELTDTGDGEEKAQKPKTPRKTTKAKK